MYYDEEMLMGLLSGLTSLLQIPSMLLNVATYVLTALALYTMAQRRGLKKPWLAWVPGFNCWLYGSLSDQYQYVVKGRNKNKRTVLLILYIVELLIAILMTALAVVMFAQIVVEGNMATEEELLGMIFGPLMGILFVCLPLVGVSIAYLVIYYMALNDIYKSMDPGNSTLFLVLSIIFSITAPFFLFFNRNKDLGMPPRRHIPGCNPQPEWEQTEDTLFD